MAITWIILVQFASLQVVSGTFVNLALRKRVFVSSRLNNMNPSLAVDGSTNTWLPYVIHTAQYQSTAWWWVDLGISTQDPVVQVYFRTDYTARRNGVQLYTSTTRFYYYPSGQLCYTVTGRADGIGIPDVLNTTCPGTWRYLLIYTRTDNDGEGAVLDFGEVIVPTCSPGSYGVNCDKSCRSRQCAVTPTSCDRYTGACPPGGCKAGWSGSDCTDCSDGLYGSHCSKYCNSRQCAVPPTSCDRNTGACPAGGCLAGYRGTDCRNECSDGYYGKNCTRYCSSRKCSSTRAVCDRVRGECAGGCKPGWREIDCIEECSAGTYGAECSMLCGDRKCRLSTSSCYFSTGRCRGGCEDGWNGTDCSQKCPSVTYGNNCNKLCTDRHCLTSSSTCDHVTGACPADGCSAGWEGIDCKTECSDGTYGAGCSMLCGDRKCRFSTSSCYHVNGRCRVGCEDGWNGTDCSQMCPSVTYGYNCNKLCTDRHCLTSSSTCDHVTGACPADGCSAGWKGIDCNTACGHGTYGANCEKSCRYRNCRTQSTSCDRETGRCRDGCRDGWRGEDCTSQCPDGTFGVSCTSCADRHCEGESDCPADGTCSGGCLDGWMLDNCTQVCPNGTHGPGCVSICGNCTGDDICNRVTGNCPSDCKPGWRGDQCKQKCDLHKYGVNCKKDCGHCNGTCNMVDGHCPGGCQKGYNGTRCLLLLQDGGSGENSSVVPVVTGTVVGVLAVILLIFIVFFIYRRRNSPKEYKKSKNQRLIATNGSSSLKELNTEGNSVYVNTTLFRESPINKRKGSRLKLDLTLQTQNLQFEPEPEEEVLDEIEMSPNRDYCNDSADVIREIAVGDLEDTVQMIKRREGGFEAEYCRLPTGFTAPYADSQKAENTGKNKFRGYYPYDHNRVRLSLLPNIPGSDYINASIMHSHDEKKTYIAAQAPNKKTVGDFWRMIWEQRCGRVIMLTGLVEAAKVKCYQYWADDGILETDHYQVEVEVSDKRANYTVRHLKVTCKENNNCRSVVQYHYTSWPDHGVPDTLALVKFIWIIRRTDTQTDGPLLVHCSAGIGRTGTYIAVDSLLDQARREEMVDVLGYVSVMREQRKNMIQTKEQYECVFQCLVEMTKFGDTSMDVENFVSSYSSRGMNSIVDRKTMREITQMTVTEKRSDSPSRHQMWVDGNQDFTVRVGPTLRQIHGYLQAVTPSPGQEKLLWKLVEENNIHNVVVISKLQVELTAKKGAKKKYGDVTVTTTGENTLNSDLTETTLKLQMSSTESSHDVKFYQLSTSPTVESMCSQLLDHAHLQHLSTDSAPVALIHSEADRKCTVFLCIMGNILSEIVEDRHVDVIGHVRAFLKCCPDLVLTQEDVEKLHQFSRDCIEMNDTQNTYANV